MINKRDELSIDSKYLIAGAYALSGDMDKAKQVLPDAFQGEKANASFGGSRYSSSESAQIDWLNGQGVLLVIAAGNGGPRARCSVRGPSFSNRGATIHLSSGSPDAHRLYADDPEWLMDR